LLALWTMVFRLSITSRCFDNAGEARTIDAASR
jgi:hypothetical protein